jgi:RNA polymerase-binding transcription factor DksA
MNKNQITMNGNPTRYSDSELEEFRELITGRINREQEDLARLKSELQDYSENTDDDTKWDPEAGSDHTTKEYLAQQISRKIDFIRNLEKAILRINNKSYGVCRETGELISKDRLRLVPHATLSVEAKNRRAAGA